MGKCNHPLWWNIFIVEYLKNGQNATQAMIKAKPKLKEDSAKVEAHRLLTNVNFKELLNSKEEKLKAVCDYTIQEYYQNLVNRARFDLVSVFEQDDITKATKVREDWLDKAKGGVMESVQVDVATLESGMVMQRLKLKPYSRPEANEKLGRLLKFDTTEDKGTTNNNLTINWNPAYDCVEAKEVKTIEVKSEGDDSDPPIPNAA